MGKVGWFALGGIAVAIPLGLFAWDRQARIDRASSVLLRAIADSQSGRPAYGASYWLSSVSSSLAT